ncbi:transcription elongation factor [Delitschia confertaspora ATCC 74209]|uniref:Transcription elongation factor n=1 Tax=Delitschia confertaspora ATCC 74209 TaxID=1513339 RepID=A0A9P4ML99_9PLEO|nr:transcription elongation factor [Delitschia confertaspora ATCC 74209]
MDVKEVDQHGKLILKAISGGEPGSSILKLLNDLKQGVKPTEELLRSTRIGITVNRLRTHKDPQVAKLATELVTKWKNEVQGAKRKVGGGNTPVAAAAKAVSNNTASPAPATQSPAPPPAQVKKHNVAPDKRTNKTDKVDINVTKDPVRNRCVGLMYDGLAHMTDELPDLILNVAREVEEAVYNNANNSTNEAYKAKLRSLYQNLKNKSNPGLRKRVLSGEITPKRFVVMTHDELKSEERRAEDERLEKENMNQAMVAQVEKSISASLTCGKCKQKKVSYSQAQTRSADEPMTTFCECMNCGHRWKFS